MESDYSTVLEGIKQIQYQKMLIMSAIDNTKDVSKIEMYNEELQELDNLEKAQHLLIQNMNRSNMEVIETEKLFNSVVGDNIGDLDRELKGLSSEDEQRVKKARMMQIADYQAKQYAMRNRILMVFVLGLIIIAVTFTLLKKDMINNTIASMIMGLVITVVFLYGSYLVYDINRRDDFEFDRFKQPDILDSKMGYETVIEHDKRFFHNIIAALAHRMGVKTDTEKEDEDSDMIEMIEKHIKTPLAPKHKEHVKVNVKDTFVNIHPSSFQGRKLLRDNPMGNDVVGADGIMGQPMSL